MAIISHKVEGVSNDVTHYARVYPVNKKGHAQSELDGQIASALTNAFPAEPSSYNLIGTYSSSQTFTAPEDGWYQIELFGRSGAGGKGAYYTGATLSMSAAGGGGGGGGAYCCSNKIKLNKGDTITIVISTTCTVTITASTGESYSVMTCTTGANGGAGSATGSSSATGGSGGSGGSASGGNYANESGGTGSRGKTDTMRGTLSNGQFGVSGSGGTGGSAGYTGGNTGGAGGKGEVYGSSSENLTKTAQSGGSAKAGFCKIYRGDTNVVAA